MRKRKELILKNESIWEDNLIKIYKDINKYCFEINNELTYDIGESVAILMHIKGKSDSKFWDINIKKFVIEDDINPINSIYWLSGGRSEWVTSKAYYQKSWAECSKILDEKFGKIILNIIRNSNTLKDIKNGFIKNINLPTIYEFLIEKKIV